MVNLGNDWDEILKNEFTKEYYQKLRKRGKSHGTAIGAVARKLVNIIFAVWTQNKPYEVHFPEDISEK